jgi:hypothetical protein
LTLGVLAAPCIYLSLVGIEGVAAGPGICLDPRADCQ